VFLIIILKLEVQHKRFMFEEGVMSLIRSSKKFKVVITECPSIRGEPDFERETLGEIGADVILLRTTDESKILKATRDADVVLCDAAQITEKIIHNFEKVRGIVEYGIGYDNIDVDAATAGGICVCNIPDYCISEVADHALSLILSLTRKIPWISQLTKEGRWEEVKRDFDSFRPLPNLELQTAGVIGFGKIGRNVVKRLRSFGLKILVYDPYVPESQITREGAESTELESLLRRSDIVTLHTPLTKGTYHLIGEREINLMKKTAMLVNTSRGPVIDQEALYQALKDCRIALAGLDVLEEEPPRPDDRLLELSNVLITPHIAYFSERSDRVIREYAVEEVTRILEGRRPKNLVNPEVLGS
jgi:D-3-phosphoglycerate dehydrogenase